MSHASDIAAAELINTLSGTKRAFVASMLKPIFNIEVLGPCTANGCPRLATKRQNARSYCSSCFHYIFEAR
jgi:hypothetical protein